MAHVIIDSGAKAYGYIQDGEQWQQTHNRQDCTEDHSKPVRPTLTIAFARVSFPILFQLNCSYLCILDVDIANLTDSCCTGKLPMNLTHSHVPPSVSPPPPTHTHTHTHSLEFQRRNSAKEEKEMLIIEAEKKRKASQSS